MEKHRIKWNERYRKDPKRKPPAAIVRRFGAEAPGGRALDIACGTGGNAVFLAERGFDVDAVDISDVALQSLADAHPTVHPFQADLDVYAPPAEQYDLILNIRFLSRRLFPYIREALRPGGMLIFETYVEAPWSQNVSCRDYLLRDNELLHSFLSMYILYYAERNKQTHKGPAKVASLVGIRK